LSPTHNFKQYKIFLDLTLSQHYSVVDGMRLKSGLLWPMPVTLDVTAEKVSAA
jgi:ATP sulfurylase